MIKIFSPTDKSYLTNGDVVLRAVRAKVHKEDNGDYYLELTAGLEFADYLFNGNIIVAPTPQGDQAFRISNPEKTNNKITLKAWHVFYDSQNYLIQDSYVVDKNCNDALDHLNSATEPQSPFSTWSDVQVVDSYRCVRASLYEAIQTVIERWGGHLVRDNFSIEVRNSIGQDNGITVEYKKNLKEITCEENWDEVVTKLMPVGKDGILLNEIDPSASVYVESEMQYLIPYCKTVTFEQDLNEEDYPDEQAYKQALVDDLYSQAVIYVEQNSVPKVNYTLKASILDKIIDIGDTIEVKDKRLGIDLMTNVISFDYDCVLGKYTEIEFGNFKPSLSNLVSNITTSVSKDVNDQLAPKIDEKTSLDQVYPVGSIYMSVNSTNPANLFGGTWTQIKDRFLLACGDNYSGGATGGESEVTLTVDQMPAHSHDLEYSTDGTTYSQSFIGTDGMTTGADYFGGSQGIDSAVTYRIKETGGGQAHNNMPPYLAVYIWQRTA